jgi:hypothetical protein
MGVQCARDDKEDNMSKYRFLGKRSAIDVRILPVLS